MKITRCEHNECEKKETCKRYLAENVALVNFKAICGMGLGRRHIDYEWYWEDKDKVNKLSEIEAIEEVEEAKEEVKNTEEDEDEI